MDDRIEIRAADRALPDDGGAVVIGLVDVPEVVGVVVRPHQVELHAAVVFGAQESVVQALFKERTAVEPIPVVDEYVDAVIRRGVDLHLHHIGIRFVYIAPERLSRPRVSREFGNGIFDGLPFAHALLPEHAGARLVAGVCRPDIGGNVVLLHE